MLGLDIDDSPHSFLARHPILLESRRRLQPQLSLAGLDPAGIEFMVPCVAWYPSCPNSL
jgi:hypothetical protein